MRAGSRILTIVYAIDVEEITVYSRMNKLFKMYSYDKYAVAVFVML